MSARAGNAQTRRKWMRNSNWLSKREWQGAASSRRPAIDRTFVAACALGAAASMSALAPAAAQTVGPLVQITKDDPFATCTADNVAQQEKALGPAAILFPNTAIEPWVAIDPTTQNLLIGHQQDRWSDGGREGWSAISRPMAAAPGPRRSQAA
jgi:hypothetical protein